MPRLPELLYHILNDTGKDLSQQLLQLRSGIGLGDATIVRLDEGGVSLDWPSATSTDELGSGPQTGELLSKTPRKKPRLAS